MNAISIIPAKTASCSVMGDYAIKKKMNVKWGNHKKGDLVLFDFNHNGTSDHIGLVISVNSNGSITTIEGNTGSGSNTNGGQVQIRTRVKSNVNYFVRPKYTKDITADMLIDTAMAEVGIKESPKNSNKVKYNTWYYNKVVSGSAYPWCATFICWLFANVKEPIKPIAKPTGKYTGTIPAPTLKKGSKGTQVKNLQSFLNWYGKFGLGVDGDFGNKTDHALNVFQKTEGIGVDGVYGSNSQKHANAYKATATVKPSASAEKAVAWARSIAKGGKYTYKKWNDKNKKTKQCPICHNLTGKYKGWNCIGFCSAAYYHSGMKNITCSCSGIGTNSFFEKVTINTWRARNGNNWDIITNGGSKGGADIPASKLIAGDVVICYDTKGKFHHVVLYSGNGKYIDCTNTTTPHIGERSYTNLCKKYQCTRAFRAK